MPESADMETFERIVAAVMGVVLTLAAGLFLILFWPVGLFLGFLAMYFFARADKPQPEIIYRGASATAAFEFGIGGPPVPAGTPPLQVGGTTVFPSAIRSITFYPDSPPNLQVFKNGLTSPEPGSGRGHRSVMQLESLGELTATGQDDVSLRYWVVQYVPDLAASANRILLADGA